VFDHVQAFYQPSSVLEALKLIQAHKGARVLAGATDITPQAQRSTKFLIDVTRLGLDYIRRERGGFAIGACATMGAVENSSKLRALANGILPQALATCGSIQLRNLATLGGNLANASPAADGATPLLALDATVTMQSARGKKTLALEKFFAGPHRTALDHALLIEIFIPDPKPRSGWSFQKLGRTETDISLVNVAAGLTLDKSGKIVAAQIALGAVAPIPLRAHAAEALLIGGTFDDDLLEAVGERVRQAVEPISDHRASAEYRREMSAALAVRALREAEDRAANYSPKPGAPGTPGGAR
jgi:CO/xanthine dehydrogenase FAD-binding subunit